MVKRLSDLIRLANSVVGIGAFLLGIVGNEIADSPPPDKSL